MPFIFALAAFALIMVVMPGGLAAQKPIPGDVTLQKTIPGDVIFEVPVKLTRLSPYVSKVAVTCKFDSRIDPYPDKNLHPEKNLPEKINPNMGTTSAANGVLYKTVELPVSAGQVDATARVVVPVTTTLFKPGQSLNYACALNALSSEPKAGSGWQPFDPKAKVTSLNVSPTPLPITGKFVW